MQYIGSLEAAEKHISANIFQENLHISLKILQICMDLQDSVRRSLQNPAEKIVQICTDSQRSKTWVNRCPPVVTDDSSKSYQWAIEDESEILLW